MISRLSIIKLLNDVTVWTSRALSQLSDVVWRSRKARPWQVDFEIKGKKGEVRIGCASPGYVFRGESLIATDFPDVESTSKDDRQGLRTKVLALIVGSRVHFPSQSLLGENGGLFNCGTTTVFLGRLSNFTFKPFWLDNPNDKIYFLVYFNEDAVWTGSIFGSAIH